MHAFRFFSPKFFFTITHQGRDKDLVEDIITIFVVAKDLFDDFLKLADRVLELVYHELVIDAARLMFSFRRMLLLIFRMQSR